MTSIVFTPIPTPLQNHRYISWCERYPEASTCKINRCRQPIRVFSDQKINFAPDSKFTINAFNGNNTRFGR